MDKKVSHMAYPSQVAKQAKKIFVQYKSVI